MCGFILRIMINAVVLFFVLFYLPGIVVDTLGGMLLGALIIGIANAAIKPVLAYVALPATCRILGWITFVTNLTTQVVVMKALPGFQIASYLSPAAVIFIVSLCSYTLSMTIQDR